MIKIPSIGFRFSHARQSEDLGTGGSGANMIGGLVKKLRSMGLWHLLWISLALSEFFTLIMNTIMSLIVWGEISPELLKIGVVDAFVVSVSVTIVLILIFREFNRSEHAAFEAMAEEKAKTDGVIAAVGDALCLVDRDFTVRIQNDAHRDLVGNAIGKKCYSLLFGTDKVCGACPAVRAMSNGRTYQSESVIEVNGRSRVFIQTASPLEAASGGVLGAVETLHDITDLRETQEKLQESTNAYKVLFVDNPLPILVYEAETFRILEANDAAVAQYGYSNEEFLQATVLDLFESKETSPAESILSSAPSDLQRVQGSTRHRKKDGSIIDVEIALHAVPFFGGHARLAIVNDITERKKNEQKILQSEARYRGLFEESPVPLLEMDFSRVKGFLDALPKLGISDFKKHFESSKDEVDNYLGLAWVLGINRAAKELLHLKLNSKESSDLGAVFPEGANEMFAEALTALAEGRQSYSAEKLIHTLHGKPIHVIFRQLVPVGFEGSLQRVLWAVTDITELKRLEEALKQSLNTKDTLIKEIHHRAKNNLAVISSLLALQQSSLTDDFTREVFRESQNRVKAMSLIHEQLYRSETLKDLNFAQYLRTLVTQLFSSYRELNQGVRLFVEIEDTSLDMDMMIPCGLIVNELVTNALKYAFNNRASGELYVGLSHTNEGYCRIVVRDDGPGIKEDINIEQSTTMGMVIVSSLARQLGATLDIRREHGSEFIVTFKETRY